MTDVEATVRVTVRHPSVVADAVRADDTEQLDTRVEDGTIVSTVRRPTVGGLRSTVDDLIVNLRVADTVAQLPDHDSTDTHE